MDDLPWRASLLLLARAAGVPTVTTSHTDGSKLKSYDSYPALRLIWQLHIRSAHLASVHASVSRVFGEQMVSSYGVPVNAIWPPILWAKEFKLDPSEVAVVSPRRKAPNRMLRLGCSVWMMMASPRRRCRVRSRLRRPCGR
jgi:hypothetical protein